MAIFPFFLGNIGQENVFYYILEGKYAFLAYKQEFHKIKKEIFSKGLTRGFGPNMAISSTFFVKEI